MNDSESTNKTNFYSNLLPRRKNWTSLISLLLSKITKLKESSTIFNHDKRIFYETTNNGAH
ncbi:MAG: hypothetical protein ABI184_01265, partial [Ginsengibacter sp.]